MIVVMLITEKSTFFLKKVTKTHFSIMLSTQSSLFDFFAKSSGGLVFFMRSKNANNIVIVIGEGQGPQKWKCFFFKQNQQQWWNARGGINILVSL